VINTTLCSDFSSTYLIWHEIKNSMMLRCSDTSLKSRSGQEQQITYYTTTTPVV
jgi:hypothetical protein